MEEDGRFSQLSRLWEVLNGNGMPKQRPTAESERLLPSLADVSAFTDQFGTRTTQLPLLLLLPDGTAGKSSKQAVLCLADR
jgi:hypothetical protein